MSLLLTPARLSAIYECLRSFPPFNRWKLPHAKEIEFRSSLRKDCQGEHTPFTNGDQAIMVSVAQVGHFNRAAVVIAHEMTHLSQTIAKTATNTQHNEDWIKRWSLVARRFGWDEKER